MSEQAIIDAFVRNVGKVIVGKREPIEQAVIAILCGGHLLLEDVPGVGKTMLARALAKTISCSYKRIQFTPDLMPSDVTGVSIYNRKTSDFEFRQGPIFANIVLADEINRTSPRTQAAVLEAMEEGNVTVDGHTYTLPRPFLLIATQNPLAHEGTFSLPEAQLDRFLVRIHLGYPTNEHEVEMLERLQDIHPIEQLKPIILSEELFKLQNKVKTIHVDDSLKQYIVLLAGRTRAHPDILTGASPRASIALMRISQARALQQGRAYVIPDDIKAMIYSTWGHRLMVHTESMFSGVSGETLLRNIVETTEVPILRYSSADRLASGQR